MITKNAIRENTYFDSIVLMSISAQLRGISGLEEVSIVMGSEANREILNSIGLLTTEGEKARPGDMIIAVRAESNEVVESVLKKAEELLSKRAMEVERRELKAPRSYEQALRMMPDANFVLVSTSGQYAGREAMAALQSGRSVMIFSDNVPVEEEIKLKKLAEEKGLLVMGPDCGTAIIGGVALGFGNALRRGPFGIVGAAGTGIQEVSSLLYRKGYGISHAIGTGSRDLSETVGGISMLQGIMALESDPLTDIIILISKPPGHVIAVKILDVIKKLKKKYVVNFLKGDPFEVEKRGISFAGFLEEAAEIAIALYEKRAYTPTAFSEDEEVIKEKAKKEARRIKKGSFLRGLFSGGTLADEAMIILNKEIGEIHSNIPLEARLKLKSSWESEGHTIVDLGDDEFTRGRPHPMIDFSIRCDRLVKEARDKDCGVILFDVVLGYGAHPDPAGELIPAIDKAREISLGEKRYITFVASITGTEEDPQNFSRQKKALEGAGVNVLPSNAQAARFSALVMK
ncbi:MAG: acyl-CoA synthetase FdrA, partial [Spirochaetota bacterium]